MCHENICVIWNQIPFVQAWLTSLQIESPSSKLWLPIDYKRQCSSVTIIMIHVHVRNHVFILKLIAKKRIRFGYTLLHRPHSRIPPSLPCHLLCFFCITMMTSHGKTFFALVTLTFDLWPWPSNLTYTWPWLDLHANIQVCTSVRSAVRVRQTDRKTDRHTEW